MVMWQRKKNTGLSKNAGQQKKGIKNMNVEMTKIGASEQLIAISIDTCVNDTMTAIPDEVYDRMKRYCDYKKTTLLAQSEYAVMNLVANISLRDDVNESNFANRYEASTIATGRSYDPKRLAKVLNYKAQIENGEIFPVPILMFESDKLVQVDGAQRLMATALTQAGTTKIIVVVRRKNISSLLEPELIQRVSSLHKTKKWFNDYQEIVEFGLKGKRSYNGRFPNILDFSLFKGKTVAEFACSNGMALFEAYYRGATRVVGFEFVPQNVEIINLMAKRFGIPVEAHRIDFNDSNWLSQVHHIIPEWDYSVFLSTYRTLELKDRDGLVRGIWEGSKEGMIFEGHQQAVDTDEFYREVFSIKAALTNYRVTQLPQGIIERPYDISYRPKYLLIRTKD